MFRLLLLATIATTSTGCFHFTAPVPFYFMENQTTVGARGWRIDIAGGGGGGRIDQGSWSAGSGGVGGALRVRHGVGEDHELGLSTYALFVEMDVKDSSHPENFAFAAKLDYKARFFQNVALLVGLGGGLTTVSPFMGGDLGLVLGGSSVGGVQYYGGTRVSLAASLEESDDIYTFFWILAGGVSFPVSDATSLLLEVGLGPIIAPRRGEASESSVAGRFEDGAGVAAYSALGVHFGI